MQSAIDRCQPAHQRRALEFLRKFLELFYQEAWPKLVNVGFYSVSIACLQSDIDTAILGPLTFEKPNHFRLRGNSVECLVYFVWVLKRLWLL